MLQHDPLRLPPFHFDAVPDPDPAFHFVPDPDPDPASQEDHVGHQSLVEYSSETGGTKAGGAKVSENKEKQKRNN